MQTVKAITITPSKHRVDAWDMKPSTDVIKCYFSSERLGCAVFESTHSNGLNLLFYDGSPDIDIEWSFHLPGLPEPIPGNGLIVGTPLLSAEEFHKTKWGDTPFQDVEITIDIITKSCSFMHAEAWRCVLDNIVRDPSILKNRSSWLDSIGIK